MAFELSEEFKDKVRKDWDKGSRSVLEHAQNEAWNLEVHGQDHDDQVRDAEVLGILVGETRHLGVDAFFERFTKWIRERIDDDETEDEDGQDDQS